MKTYWGVEVYTRVFLISAPVGVSGQFHAPAPLPPEKGSPVHNGLKAEWAPDPIRTI
jgi:hypothetical protein